MRQRKGWTRLRGGCGGVWEHASGWRVRHCGHPTALWPYYGEGPGGEMLLTGGITGLGCGFQKLVFAQAAVEELLNLSPRPKEVSMKSVEDLKAASASFGKLLDAIPRSKKMAIFEEAQEVEFAIIHAARCTHLLDFIRGYFLETMGEEGEDSPFVKKIDELVPRKEEGK